MKHIYKSVKIILPLILLVWCAVLLAQKIDLPLADIGRHIKNGEILVHSSWHDKWQLLNTNFYSYTEPQHPFINHHWLTGVIFYVIHQLFGFKGLSLFYIAMVVLAFFLFYRLAQKEAGSAVASILAILVLPIIASRTEIRPEGFTYLFMAVFFWMLTRSARGSLITAADIRADHRRLFILPVLMLFWVNLHIGFIFGFLILGAFWLESLIHNSKFIIHDSKSDNNKNKFRFISLIFLLCIIAALISPFGIRGLLYPLNIFREYGYLIVENQSVMFLQRLGMGSNLYFGLFKFLLGLGALSFAARLIKQRNWKVFPYQDLLLLGTAGFLAILATRNFPIFGLLFLPIVGANIKSIAPELKHPAYKILPVIIAILTIIFGSFRFWENYKYKQSNFGIGLMPGVESAAEFYKKQRIQGPIFNNYDIGGYLIYELTRNTRRSLGTIADTRADQVVFTDNRPEAYSIDHFQKDYIPAQQDNVKWKALDSKYNFNAIFFSHRDLTPWGQAFLISKVQDEEWAPVFADNYNIIFIKRNEKNQELIKKYELPKEKFQVIQS